MNKLKRVCWTKAEALHAVPPRRCGASRVPRCGRKRTYSSVAVCLCCVPLSPLQCASVALWVSLQRFPGREGHAPCSSLWTRPPDITTRTSSHQIEGDDESLAKACVVLINFYQPPHLVCFVSHLLTALCRLCLFMHSLHGNTIDVIISKNRL